MQTGRGDVDGELADGDVDAADALVADTEDAFGVGGHQQVHILTVAAVVAQRLLRILGVVDVEENSARSAVLVAVLFDRLVRPWGCRRSAASPPGVRPAAGRTAPRCGHACCPASRSWRDHRAAGGTGRTPVAAAPPTWTPRSATGPATPTLWRCSGVNAVPRLSIGLSQHGSAACADPDRIPISGRTQLIWLFIHRIHLRSTFFSTESLPALTTSWLPARGPDCASTTRQPVRLQRAPWPVAKRI